MNMVWKVREGTRKVRTKLKVNQSPGYGFPSVLKVGISQVSEPESYLPLVTLLWVTISMINNGVVLVFLSTQKRRPSSTSHEILCGREAQS